MGEVIISNVAGRILSRLHTKDVKEMGSIWGITKLLRDLETSVSSLHYVLLDAEEKQVNNIRVRNWLMKLEPVICESDLFLDDISTSAESLVRQLISANVISKQVLTLFFSSSNKLVWSRKIKKFKQMIDEISLERNFHLDHSSEKSDFLSNLGKLTNPNVFQEEVIGRDQDRMRIVETLLDPQIKYNLSAIAVVGARGLGKTSLARLVFHDKAVQIHFELKMWVSASGVSDVTLLVAKIIQSATNRYPAYLEMHQLQTNLRKEIHGKRFLLVLDDLRIEDHELWQGLKEFLTGGAEGSKIVITGYCKEGAGMNSIEALLDPKTKYDFSVAPAVSIGGFGRSSLARHFFHDKEIQNQFELKMWVPASDISDMTSLVAKIIQFVTGKYPPGHLKMHQLQSNLRNEIYRKRYLLVIDDPRIEDLELCQGLKELFTWEEKGSSTSSALQLWQSFKHLFSKSAWGSKVIVTTSSQQYADITSEVLPYKIRALNANDSWSLFKQMAFDQEQGPEVSSMELIGRDILNDCGGNALAIRTLGSMLYFKSFRDWSSFRKELSDVSAQDGDILALLKLSHRQLSPHLKQYVAYCSLFPKDHEIDVQILINLWIAEEIFESSDPSKCLMEVGYEYVIFLLQRCFFHEAKKDEWGNIIKCKMPNLMHELASSVAGSRYAILDTRWNTVDEETRHTSFNFHLDSSGQIPTSLLQAKKLRTILLPSQLPCKIEDGMGKLICDVLVLNFKLLHVLDLHNSGIKKVSTSIGKLKYLRYLDLSENLDIKLLPDSIPQLQNLETLKLNYCIRLQELPRNMKKLVKLRILEIEGCYGLTYLPHGFGQLTNLQTLSEFVLNKGNDSVFGHYAELNELAGLSNLRGELRIKNLRRGLKSKDAILKEKKYIRSLMLIWYIDIDIHVTEASFYEVTLEGLEPHPNISELLFYGYGGLEFSSWLPSLTNLGKLSLSRCMNCQQLPLLNRLFSLKVLIVDEMPNLEYISNSVEDDILSSSTALLPSLKELRLTDLPKLEGWWRDVINVEHPGPGRKLSSTSGKYLMPSIPSLSTLVVEDCPKLSSMPLLPNIEEMLLNNSGWKPTKSLQRTLSDSSIHRLQKKDSSKWGFPSQ